MLLLYLNLIFRYTPTGHNYYKILAGNGLTLATYQKSLVKIRKSLSGYCTVVKWDFIPTWTWIYLNVTEPCSEIILLMLLRATTHLMILILVPHLLILCSCTDICVISVEILCLDISNYLLHFNVLWHFLILTFMYGICFIRLLRFVLAFFSASSKECK